MSDEFAAIANTYRRSLPSDGFQSVFRIDGLDRLGVPVVQAVTIESQAPAVIGYGYGLDAEEAALGALGELCEEVQVGRHIAAAPVRRDSYAALVAILGVDAVANPLTLCLPAGSPWAPDMPLDWVTAQRWPDGEPVLVPRDWVAAYGDQLGRAPELITPITNGLGAGLDRAHALAHGLMELLQRDGNVGSFRALDQGVVVELDEALPPDITGLLTLLRNAGISPLIKLAGVEFGIAGLYVVGDDPDAALPIQITACGEAAHPDKLRGLRKALLEFVGSRARKAATHGPIDRLRPIMPPAYFARQLAAAETEEEEARALAAMTEWVGLPDAAALRERLAKTVFSERRHVRFSDLPSVPASAIAAPADRLALLVARLRSAAIHDVLFVDCSPPGGEVVVVKVIVPGLESELMSYDRIGWRMVRRLRARDDALIRNDAADGTRRVRLTPADEQRAGGPAWFDAARARTLVAPLYPLYREPGPLSAQLALQGRHPPR